MTAPMSLEVALETLTQPVGSTIELDTLRAAIAKVRAALPFIKAAEHFCDVWERDFRNSNKPDIGTRLFKSRELLFMAYRAMKGGK